MSEQSAPTCRQSFLRTVGTGSAASSAAHASASACTDGESRGKLSGRSTHALMRPVCHWFFAMPRSKGTTASPNMPSGMPEKTFPRLSTAASRTARSSAQARISSGPSSAGRNSGPPTLSVMAPSCCAMARRYSSSSSAVSCRNGRISRRVRSGPKAREISFTRETASTRWCNTSARRLFTSRAISRTGGISAASGTSMGMCAGGSVVG
mmetsp:Transcript_30580/g.97611  ORF Transcript_30580/g.97611 Transcript_30580/m.97611 type:complete len:209 (+) Transcript_30580:1903-2529(+)